MSYSKRQGTVRLKKRNRQAKMERSKRKGKIETVSGGGNRTLARIIHEKSQRIKKKNAGIS